MIYGYARVSTRLQETHLQLDALHRAGAEKIIQEKASSVGERPALRQLLTAIQPGDLLVVWKLDRIARSLRDLLTIMDALHSGGGAFKSLTEPIDTSSPVGVFIFQILGAVGQFERTLIRERTLAGQVAAYNRGVRWGGQPLAINPDDAAHVVLLYSTGLFTQPMLAEIFGCSLATIFRLLYKSKRPADAQAKKLPVLGKLLRD